MTPRKFPLNISIYEVGGCVRDSLLGYPVKDYDYIVVGATPQDMLDAGFIQVGADFPVFLHPDTNDEYALARTERKQGLGYNGFTVYAAPNVTLEEDLSRRDFTMNAIARSKEGVLYDPYNGREDLQKGILRHVGPAFEEDPVRVLRAARFIARYNFKVAPQTWHLMQTMVNRGQLNELTKERVALEFKKNIDSPNPKKMWNMLDGLNVLTQLVPKNITLSKSWLKIDHTAVQEPAQLWGALLFLAAPCMNTNELKEIIHTYRYPKETIYVYNVIATANRTTPWKNPEQAVKYWTQSDARRQTEAWIKIQPVVQSLYPKWSTVQAQKLNTACASIQEGLIVQTMKSLGQSFCDLPLTLMRRRVDAFQAVNRHDDSPHPCP